MTSGVANQRRASDPKTSAWVSANAGTGKTHVLVDRLSRLLLGGAKAERLLCLTFTKAAAAEMANRLNQRLALWARATDEELEKSLLYLTNSSPDVDDMATARRLFGRVLDAPGGLKIRTIHSFCESLLGRFPLEAGISPHFSVLDERTATEIRNEARDRILIRSRRPGGEEVAKSLDILAGLVGDDGLAKLIKELTSHRAAFADMRRRAGSTEKLIATAYQTLGLAPGQSKTGIIKAAAADGAFDAEGLRRAAEALAKGKKTDIQRAAAITQWINYGAAERAATFFPSYIEAFITQDGKPRASLITKDVAKNSPAAVDLLAIERDRLDQVGKRLNAARVGEATAAMLGFAAALLDQYTALKAARAVVDYDDLILNSARLLQSDDGVSWVHFKLDGGIDHILIDEAQDTSPEQWRVIRRLADDFHSGLGLRDPGQRTVFAVGDEKQSIYSFQGADPDGFREMRNYFHKRISEAGCKWLDMPLTVSYRSVEEVLGTVDAVFATTEAADGVRGEDEEIRHFPTRLGEAGLVEVWPAVKPVENDDTGAWDEPVDRPGARQTSIVLADRIAETIKGWIDGGEKLASADRPIRPDDIMILVRKRGTFTDAMIRALKLRKIEVAGSDRMKLTGQLAVMDLIAVGRFALLAEDDLSLAEVLKGPFVGFDDEALFDLAFGRSGSLWRALRKRAEGDQAAAGAVEYLKDILDRADFSPPFEFYNHILGAKGGRRAIQSRLGHEAVDPVDEFLSLALDFERNHTPSLQAFINWIEVGETEIKRDLSSRRAEVRVLTVHGAKGLEANIVFLPDTHSVHDKKMEEAILWGKNSPLWPVDKKTEPEICQTLRQTMRRSADREYHRLLYVAMTRARDRLYICGFESKSGPPQGCWYQLLRDAMETTEKAEKIIVPGFDEPGLRLASKQQAGIEKPDDPVSALPVSSSPPSWATREPELEPIPSRPLNPSRPSQAEPPSRSPLGCDGEGRFKRGRLIHRLLQSLPDMEPGKHQAAAMSYLANPSHGLAKKEQADIAGETMAVLENPDFAAIFGPDSLAEVPLSGIVGKHVISAQLDRLLIEKDMVTVIDYKTNRPAAKSMDEVPSIYLAQMAAYRDILVLIYPGRKVRCFILWTDGPTMTLLSDRILDPHAP